MDFGKLKDGVIEFSVFLASNLFWICVAAYSVWIAVGNQIGALTSKLIGATQETLQNTLVRDILENYGFKPLLPAIAFFFTVFLIHANKRVLVEFGKYIPPTIVFEYMVGFRDISTGRWEYVTRKLAYRYSFEDLRLIIDSRYREAEAKQFQPRGDGFEICKSLFFLNVVMFALAAIIQHSLKIQNAVLFMIFAAGAAVAGALRLYHNRNASIWAIEEVIRQLLAEHVFDKPEEKAFSDERGRIISEEIKQSCKAMSERRSFSLSWELPFVGTVGVFKSFLRH